jgi:hypothetical protein
VEAKKTPRYYTCDQKTDLDIKTSVNKIGEIVNLSQFLNSLMWHRLNSGATMPDVMPLYHDICKLAVLSGMEIDRAKKEFVIDSGREIDALKNKYRLNENCKNIKPRFFRMITQENGYKPNKNIYYKPFDTSMDYMQHIINVYNFRKGREQKQTIVPLMSMVRLPAESFRQGYYYSQRDNIVSIVRKAKEDIEILYIDYAAKQKDEKEVVWRLAAQRKQECIDAIDKMSNCECTMYLTLKEIDNDETKDISKFLFEVLFGKPNKSFFKMIEKSREQLYELKEKSSGKIALYDLKYTKEPVACI